jgi:hypothetical protein
MHGSAPDATRISQNAAMARPSPSVGLLNAAITGFANSMME